MKSQGEAPVQALLVARMARVAGIPDAGNGAVF